MARAIDADALQELCNKRIKDTWNSKTAPVSWAEAYAEFKDDIDSMPTLTPPNEWISVEDRLPENSVDGEAVLAVVSGKPHENIKLIGALMIAEYFAGEGWLVNEYPEWEEPTVTHWMPLPQPPKEAQP